MKIAVYAINHNESKFFRRFAESVAEADHILIFSNNCTDGSHGFIQGYAEIAEALRSDGRVIQSVNGYLNPFRFDTARNIALSLLPDDIDVCVAMDMDEVASPGWRQAIEAVWDTAKVIRANYNFVWSRNEDGSPLVSYIHDRVHSRHGFHWKYHCHETLEHSVPGIVTLFIPGLEFHHHPDPDKSRGQYLGLLEEAVREWPTSDRPKYYLSREYYYCSRFQKSIDSFLEFMNYPGATFWELVQSMYFISKCYEAMGDLPAAHEWAMKGYGRTQISHTSMRSMETAYWVGNYERVLTIGRLALNEVWGTGYIPNDARYTPLYALELMAISSYHTGDLDSAILYSERYLAREDSVKIRDNLVFYRGSHAKTD